jgi:lipoate-protein ligase A
MKWHVLHTPALDGASNMAVDHALLLWAAARNEGVVRVYSWSRPTLSLGRNQTAIGVYDAGRATSAGIDIVRRFTGGRAVLHHREITYAVCAPAADGAVLRCDYERINRLLLAALRALGVPAELAAPATRTPPPGGAPCFELPAKGEIVVGPRKLVGSAQVRDQGAYLQHGSILVHDDQGLLRQVAVGHVPIVPAATLTDILAREVTSAEFADLLFAAVQAQWDPEAAPFDLSQLVETRALASSRYASPEWTWRR